MLIRPVEAGDRPAIVELYNHYITTSPCTFDLEPYTLESRQPWFEQFSNTGPHRLLVAVEGERLLGYAGTMRFRPKPAYGTSVEVTCYVQPDAHGKGIGAALYQALFKALAGEDLHRALAGITLPNAASIRLHEKLGFRQVAHFTEQGRKLGRYWDVVWLERPLNP